MHLAFKKQRIYFQRLAKVQSHISGIQQKMNSEVLQRMQRKSSNGLVRNFRKKLDSVKNPSTFGNKKKRTATP